MDWVKENLPNGSTIRGGIGDRLRSKVYRMIQDQPQLRSGLGAFSR